MATIFRAPILTPIPKRPSQQPDAVQNMLTLRPPNPTQPWHQDDWPTSARVRISIKSDAPANLVPVQNPPPVIAPFFQSDWPSLARRSLSLKSDAASEVFALRRPNPEQPFKQGDWPLAWPSRPPQKSDAASEVFPLRRPNPASPFSQDDWPGMWPRRAAALVDSVVNLRPIQVPTEPFGQTDWPSPSRGGPSPYSDGPNLLGTTLAPSAPPVTGDYLRGYVVNVGRLMGTR